MFNSITLIGAYGRDYKSKEVLIADLIENNRDFMIYESRQYTSARELRAMGHIEVKVRYNKLKSVAMIGLREVK